MEASTIAQQENVQTPAPSAGKLILVVYLDSQGPEMEHFQERGTTINSTQTVRC
jgi:hypothetical protein